MSETEAAPSPRSVETRDLDARAAEARLLGGSPDAARTAWTPFRSAIARRARPLWVEASKRAAVAGMIACVLALLGRKAMGGVAALVALSLLALSFLAPRAYRAIDRFFLAAASIVGRALSYLLLAPVFFVVMTPLRLLLRTGARARWGSGRDPSRASHWKARDRRPPRLDRPY